MLLYKNRELSIIKELKHDNCCYLYDYFYTTASDNPDEEYLNLIMEYMPETLYREVRNFAKQKKNMPLLLIKLYAYQIIRGLSPCFGHMPSRYETSKYFNRSKYARIKNM